MLRLHTNFLNEFSIRNSIDLTNKIKNTPFPLSSMLVSFDVVNLFPSIPPDDCLSLIRSLLFKNRSLLTSQILDLCSLLDLVFKQNFFQFDNKFYAQTSGLAMGSNISPLAAEIFMNNLESKIFVNRRFSHLISFWYRYVDDCLVLFTGSLDDLTELNIFLNSLHPNIKFTYEIESNNSLPYLDLLISRSNNAFEFQIYRKPTYTDCVIPFNSNHPYSHKVSSFRSLLHRLCSIPMSRDNFNNEFNIIKNIASNNNFPLSLIYSLFFKISSKIVFKNLSNAESNDYLYLSLPYFGPFSNFLTKIFKKFNICISFSTKNNLKNILVNNKDLISPLDKSGVYKISCSSCNASYIGQTGRKFSLRLKEHLYPINRYKNTDIEITNSAFADHILSTKHSFSSNLNIRFLHFVDKGLLLNNLESLEIHRLLNDSNSVCLNDLININNSPLLKLNLQYFFT